MSVHKLYGDGLHDDTEALQSLIDMSIATRKITVPAGRYVVKRTLDFHMRGDTLFDANDATFLIQHHDFIVHSWGLGDDKPEVTLKLEGTFLLPPDRT